MIAGNDNLIQYTLYNFNKLYAQRRSCKNSLNTNFVAKNRSVKSI